MKRPLVLVCVLLVVGLATSVRAAEPRTQADDPAAIRAELTRVYTEWGRARTGFDRPAIERMLAPEFYVEIDGKRHDRGEFIGMVATRRAGLDLVRFDARILTLRRAGDAWETVITEKLEAQDAAGVRSSSLWVTRDRFRRGTDGWQVLSSEAIGAEGWPAGVRPPFDDWDA